jgi:diguanylate cyclase (GGDEF)-like protein
VLEGKPKEKANILNLDKIQLVIQKFDHLPSLPGIAIKLIEAIKKPEPDIREVSRLISSDAALSANILKIINSAFYGLTRKITSVDQAIKLLGLNAIENLSLSLIIKTNFIKENKNGSNLTGFWKDSLVGAIAARMIAERIKIRNAEDVFFLGLLKNIGSLTLAYLFPDQYSMVLHEIQSKKIKVQDAENLIFGFNHMDVGAILTKSWGFPEVFYIPIRHHHCVESLPENCDNDIQIRTKILHLASLYIDILHGENMTQALWFAKHFIGFYGFENSLDATEIGKDIIKQTKEIFPIFEIQFRDENELEILLDSAKQELINVSMQMVGDMIGKDIELRSLRKQANIDAMTELHNYKAFCETLDQEISRASRYKTSLCLVLADIDFFKLVNDRYGHLAGDQVLKAVSQNLKSGLRESDFIARYGGEEFAIVLPHTKIEDALYVSERLREKIKALEFYYDGQSVRITMSFGVASIHQVPKVSFENFIKLADDALYVSKKMGRDRCSIAAPN